LLASIEIYAVFINGPHTGARTGLKLKRNALSRPEEEDGSYESGLHYMSLFGSR